MPTETSSLSPPFLPFSFSSHSSPFTRTIVVMSLNTKPTREAALQSKARVFVGQLEPYVTEEDLYPVFSCYGRVLHVNVVRHSTKVTPNEERRIPTAFVWYETTAEADAAIAALHNNFSFSPVDEEESKRRYIQVSYAEKSPECTNYGREQRLRAETGRRPAPPRRNGPDGSGDAPGSADVATA